MTQKKKIHKLSFKPDFEFVLLGISSHENDYRLSWVINNHLSFGLSKTNNIALNNKNSIQQFSVFSYHDEESYNTYYLINNISEQGFLFKELKNIDYFFQINGELIDYELQKIIIKLREIDIIASVFRIDVATLKNPAKLLLK